ncbi:MAG: c-type cytochrome [Betaproteobacteria bacterium]|nr:c-type cytochrome [Betaproteobacteria bacterium]
MKTRLLIVTLALSFAAAQAWAGGDAAAGEKKAKEVCAACHGEGGAKPTTPDYPVLASQREDYLEHSLHAYKSGKRKNPIMGAMAANLSDQEIADLAAYFSSQDPGRLTYKYYH